MAFIEAPSIPLRDVRLHGGMLGFVRFIATARMLAAMALMVTYFQTWHVVYEVRQPEQPVTTEQAATDQRAIETGKSTVCTGYSHYDHKLVAPALAALIFALGYLLFSKPSLSSGMISAAGTMLLSFLIFRSTFDMKHMFDRIEPHLPQALFGMAFIVLALSAAADLMFHPIIYVWARRDQERR
ncbi:MAG: hypothetical protein ACXVEF_30365 [Polyangiales bacterium]